MGLLPLLLLAFFSLSNAELSRMMGVNYGQLGDNLPSASKSISLVKSLRVGRVKIYDANPEILKALSGTPIQVSVMVPNEIISNISSNQSAADEWVVSKILPFHPETRIRILLVGNEILTDTGNKQRWYDLVPTMRRLRHSLKTHNLAKLKVGTPLAMDALQTSFPPSNGTFRPDIADTVMRPMLQFLNRTKSFYFADVYPYFAWAANPKGIKLEYALLDRCTGITYTDPVSGLTYTNLLDQQLDALVAAMARIGFGGVRIVIAETGWPNAGDIDQIGANIYNSATYNRNLARKMARIPAMGTPARPGWVIPTYVFSLFNENRKIGPGTERNWGLFYPNGSEVYEVDLTGKRPDTSYSPLPEPINNEPYRGKIWCVVAGERVNASELGEALTYACGQGNGTCDAIQRGKSCYEPDSLVSHASYAFNSYWNQFRSVGGTCFFGGLAVQTTKDPSHGSCKFPAVQLTEAH